MDQGTQGWAGGEKGRPSRGPGLGAGRMEAAPGPAASADRRTESGGQWRAAAATGWATVCSRRGGRWRVAAADRERESERERERVRVTPGKRERDYKRERGRVRERL
jgi:hypothetical protein